MDFKIELQPCPAITLDDISFSPPIIPIAEEESENAGALTRSRILATMIFPKAAQAPERQKCSAIIYAYNLSTSHKRITLDSHILRLLIDEPTLDLVALIKKANDAAIRGHVAGITLFLIHELYLANNQGIANIEPSINMAIKFIQDGVTQNRKTKTIGKLIPPRPHPNLNAYWTEYKQVSHLWLASYLLEQSQQAEDTRGHKRMMPLLSLSDTTNYRKLFKLSEHYRLFGEGFKYRRSNKKTQGRLFVKDEAWRPSPNLDLTGITITDENKIYEGLSALIARWKQKKK